VNYKKKGAGSFKTSGNNHFTCTQKGLR